MTTERLLFDRAVSAIVSMILAATNTRLVTISGCTCSGKSTLTEKLEGALDSAGTKATIIRLDDYFRDENDPELPRVDGMPIFDLPSSYHGNQFIRDIRTLIEGESIRCPEYDLNRNRRKPALGRIILPGRAIIAEGLYAGSLASEAGLETIAVYMETPIEICLCRRVERDVKRYGVTPERARIAFRSRVLPYLQLQRWPERDIADIIVTSSEKGANHGF